MPLPDSLLQRIISKHIGVVINKHIQIIANSTALESH